jgi:hypothetical protein
MDKLLKKIWPLRSVSARNQYILQQAARRASRGPGSTLFHLLIPISVLTSFSLFYVVPLLVIWRWEFSQIAHSLMVYLKWSPPVLIVVALSIYGWGRNKLLEPHIKDIAEGQEEE